MKMISSTRSTSIIGVTLMSEVTPPPPPPVDIAMGYSSLSASNPPLRSTIATRTRAPARRPTSTAAWIFA